jgi:hypothetical protein
MELSWKTTEQSAHYRMVSTNYSSLAAFVH